MTNTPSPTDEDRELVDEVMHDLHTAVWEAGKCAEPLRGYPVPKAELPAFSYGKDCATTDIECVIKNLVRDRLESLLSDRAKLARRVRSLANHGACSCAECKELDALKERS